MFFFAYCCTSLTNFLFPSSRLVVVELAQAWSGDAETSASYRLHLPSQNKSKPNQTGASYLNWNYIYIYKKLISQLSCICCPISLPQLFLWFSPKKNKNRKKRKLCFCSQFNLIPISMMNSNTASSSTANPDAAGSPDPPAPRRSSKRPKCIFLF